eukprot:9477266-Pyramimonas_sp.AAC.1
MRNYKIRASWCKITLWPVRSKVANLRVDRHACLASRAGDWECSGCGNVNFAFRTKCNRCNGDKADAVGNQGGGGY